MLGVVVKWLKGVRSSLWEIRHRSIRFVSDRPSHSTAGPVSTWMGDYLWAVKRS